IRALYGSPGPAASSSQMGRFETKWLSRGENLAALVDLPGQWIDKPVVARYRGIVKRLYFRGDAAFASPEIHEFLEAEGFGYTIRLPANRVLQDRIGYLLKHPSGDHHTRCAATSSASAIRRKAGRNAGGS